MTKCDRLRNQSRVTVAGSPLKGDPPGRSRFTRRIHHAADPDTTVMPPYESCCMCASWPGATEVPSPSRERRVLMGAASRPAGQ